MTPALRAVWALVLAGMLAGAMLLGWAASRGAVEPGLHGAAGVVAAVLAIGSHVRRGSGWDFLAAVLLLAAVGLGTVLEGGSRAAALHLIAAIPAVLLSAGLHLLGASGARLPLAGETRG